MKVREAQMFQIYLQDDTVFPFAVMNAFTLQRSYMSCSCNYPIISCNVEREIQSLFTLFLAPYCDNQTEK